MENENKYKALMKHLDLQDHEIMDIQENSDESYEYGREEYLVLTDSEADTKARESILETLWAFRPEFIVSHVAGRTNDRVIDALRKMQVELCEDANELVKAMIKDLDHFVDDAISADGRGHFLSSYDGYEREVTFDNETFYIYRTN
jgi:hypothetical protein